MNFFLGGMLLRSIICPTTFDFHFLFLSEAQISTVVSNDHYSNFYFFCNNHEKLCVIFLRFDLSSYTWTWMISNLYILALVCILLSSKYICVIYLSLGFNDISWIHTIFLFFFWTMFALFVVFLLFHWCLLSILSRSEFVVLKDQVSLPLFITSIYSSSSR